MKAASNLIDKFEQKDGKQKEKGSNIADRSETVKNYDRPRSEGTCHIEKERKPYI